VIVGGRQDARGVRRALVFAVLAAALLYAAIGWRLGATGRDGAAFAVLGRVTAVALPVLLLPSLVRVLAHPRRAPMPAATARAAVAGTAAALCCLTGALLPAAARALGPVDAAALALLGASAGGTALSAVLLRRARTTGPEPGTVVPARPDLMDDVSTLVARALPGSAPARAADRLNRRLDSWWGPRRGVALRVAATPGYGRATVAAASPEAADTVTLAPPVDGTASVTAGARATTA
jgi:hypothetical protein